MNRYGNGWIFASQVPSLKDKDRLVLVFVIALLLTVSMSKLFFQRPSLNVSAASTVMPWGVYWDATCSRPVTSVDWGQLTVGETKTIMMYVRNEGNEKCILSIAVANWQAGNKSNVATFSCGGPEILPSQTVQINPSLTIFPNASGITSFSFDVAFAAIFVRLGDFDMLFASNTNVRVVYPSSSTSKPLDCGAGMISDWTASAIVSTKLGNFTEGYDTQVSFVDQTTGQAIGASGTGIVSFGGPVVNPIVKHAESDSTPSADRAPIRFNNKNGVFSFQYSNGTNVPGASMLASAVNGNQDFFLIEVFSDGAHRYLMLCYGFGWQGTYAAGKYFHTVIYSNLGSQNESWIILKWQDTNGNGFVNGPNDGDTYTIIAQGN